MYKRTAAAIQLFVKTNQLGRIFPNIYKLGAVRLGDWVAITAAANRSTGIAPNIYLHRDRVGILNRRTHLLPD